MGNRFQFSLIRVAACLLLIYFLVLFVIFRFNDLFLSQIILILFILYISWSALAIRYEKDEFPAETKKKGSVDLNKRKFLYLSAIGIISVFAIATLPEIEVSSSNLLYNGNFKLGTDGWYLPQGTIFSWKVNDNLTVNNYPSLEVQTDQTYIYDVLWSWISSELIKVEYGAKYSIATHMAGVNVLQSHIVIQPYDASGNALDYQLTQVPSGQNGTFDFAEYVATVEIPYGVEYIGIYLNAGLAYNSDNPGKTYFADLSVTKASYPFH